LTLEIEETLKQSFTGLQVIELQISNIKIKEKDQRLEEFKERIQQKVRNSFGSMDEIRNQPIFRAYRDFFWRVGIDPTKTRPAREALTRRIVGGKDLPTINTLVDCYNLASVMTSVAIAAFDLNSISHDSLLMRKANAGEMFKGIGMDSEMRLKGIEVVIEDLKSHKLIAVYPYRDSDDSKVTLETKNALLMMCGVPGISLDRLEQAKSLSKEYVESFCLGS
jgi:DNA/RNA-binding domain of Phe-tRNA-synthetase-like protein